MTVKWDSLNNIAAHIGRVAPFPDELPDAIVCDFDAMKNTCCVHRVGMLSSVDTVLVGKDGRLYFVEFKDSVKNPIANLKKKAFDSLSVFWLTLGRNESIASICSRAVFVYVKPDGESQRLPSEMFADDMLFHDSGMMMPPTSRNGSSVGDWLNDFKVAGLYVEIEILTASEFSTIFTSRFETGENVSFNPRRSDCGVLPTNEHLVELASLNRLLIKARSDVGGSGDDFCDDSIEALDLKKISFDLLKNRMYLPEENLLGERRDMLCIAAAVRDKTVYMYHNWELINTPLAHLVNCVFDSSYLVAWIVFPAMTFEQSSSILSAVVAYDGDFLELRRSPNVLWLQNFYDNYIIWFRGEQANVEGCNAKFGLACFVHDGLYAKITTTGQLPLLSELVNGRT